MQRLAHPEALLGLVGGSSYASSKHDTTCACRCPFAVPTSFAPEIAGFTEGCTEIPISAIRRYAQLPATRITRIATSGRKTWIALNAVPVLRDANPKTLVIEN